MPTRPPTPLLKIARSPCIYWQIHRQTHLLKLVTSMTSVIISIVNARTISKVCRHKSTQLKKRMIFFLLLLPPQTLAQKYNSVWVQQKRTSWTSYVDRPSISWMAGIYVHSFRNKLPNLNHLLFMVHIRNFPLENNRKKNVFPIQFLIVCFFLMKHKKTYLYLGSLVS